jgi:transposase
MRQLLVSDRQWVAIAPRMPGHRRTGRPRVDDRQCLEAVLHVLLNGCRWHDLPAGSTAPVTAWRRLRIWQETGAWPRIWQAYLGGLDAAGRRLWGRALVSGAFVPAQGRAPLGAGDAFSKGGQRGAAIVGRYLMSGLGRRERAPAWPSGLRGRKRRSHSRTTMTEQVAWRTTRAALGPSR